MNDMNSLLMMLMMGGGLGGMGGGADAKPKDPYPGASARPVADGALYNMLNGTVGPQKQFPGLPDESVLNMGASNIPVSRASVWDQFGGYLNKMPADTRMMMGMQGLAGLANALRGN